MIYRVEFVVSAERGRVVPTDLVGEAAHHFEGWHGGSAQRVGDYQVSIVAYFAADSDDDAREAVRSMRFHARSHDVSRISVGRGRNVREVAR